MPILNAASSGRICQVGRHVSSSPVVRPTGHLTAIRRMLADFPVQIWLDYRLAAHGDGIRFGQFATVRHTTGVHRRLLLQVLHGASDANIRFSELSLLLRDLGFQERVRGSHHIFTREGIEEILNLQPRSSMAKPYQVRQVRNVIVRYKLAEGIE